MDILGLAPDRKVLAGRRECLRVTLGAEADFASHCTPLVGMRLALCHPEEARTTDREAYFYARPENSLTGGLI
jgi:hypothetical protein